jgi:CRP-like cAMP-binding protein
MIPADYLRLQPHLMPVPFATHQVLHEANQSIEYVCFPESGIASVTTDGSSQVEVGVIGREGMTGVPLVLGTDRTPFRCFIQLEGHGLRLAAPNFAVALHESRSFDHRLRLYAQALNVQTCATAFANAEHTLEMRLARWLRMFHDRVDGDDLALTHEFLAMMLGVRRAGVTTTIHLLEGNGLIRGTRGLLKVRDRAGLERLADDAYGLPEAEYARLMEEGVVVPLQAA